MSAHRSWAGRPVAISKLRCPRSTYKSNSNSKSKPSYLMISIMQKANMSLTSPSNSKWSPYPPIQYTSNPNRISQQQTTPLPLMPPHPWKSHLLQAKYWQPPPATKHLRIKTRFYPNYQVAHKTTHQVKSNRENNLSKRLVNTRVAWVSKGTRYQVGRLAPRWPGPDLAQAMEVDR